jgi:Zn-dependent peptidase ImmA (M78 family)
MSAHVAVSPAVLEWATERARMSDDEVERNFPDLGDWASGTQRPTLKQLEEFARKVHAPLGYLLLDAPPDEPVPIPDFRTVRDEALHRPSADLLETIYTCQRRQDWFHEHLARLGADSCPLASRGSKTDSAKKVAGDLREALGFSHGAASHGSNWDRTLTALIDRIEARGVLVMSNSVVGNDNHRALDPQEFRGFALADTLAPLIFVNGKDSKAARVFTLIHELAHIWVGETALSDVDAPATSTTERERWCNQVAAEFLVPVDDFPASGADLSTATLEALAERFGVSTLVILRRFYELGRVAWEPYRRRYLEEQQRIDQLMARDGGKGNHYNNQYRRLSPVFARAVMSSAYEGGTSFTEAYDLLNAGRHATFEELARRMKVI